MTNEQAIYRALADVSPKVGPVLRRQSREEWDFMIWHDADSRAYPSQTYSSHQQAIEARERVIARLAWRQLRAKPPTPAQLALMWEIIDETTGNALAKLTAALEGTPEDDRQAPSDPR